MAVPCSLASACIAAWLLQGFLVICPVQGAPPPQPQPPAATSAFLAQSQEEAGQCLHRDLTSALGDDSHTLTDFWVDRLQDDLRPLFNAIPKNSRGLLGEASVRYALHRHFVHKHGMYVKGLEPAGEAWNSSSPVAILEGLAPPSVRRRFEDALRGGFGLKDLALFAATVEHFVQEENIKRLANTYRLLGHSVEAGLSQEELNHVIAVYMALLICAERTVMVSDPDDIPGSFIKEASTEFPSFHGTLAHVRQVQNEIVRTELGEDAGPVPFRVVERIVVAALQNFGRQQDAECRAMSRSLAAKEARLSGRVTLGDFYEAAGSRFADTEEYLLETGVAERAVAASGAEQIYVRIPNFVYSAANCLVTATMYSVCCVDACEGLLRHVEARVGAPTAPPVDVARIVAALPSDTVAAPRALSEGLVARLGEIAGAHSGEVPLHGRLFALWLHHAYPHECPFPAKAGTTRPMTADDWLRERRNGSEAQGAAEMGKAPRRMEAPARAEQHSSPDPTGARGRDDPAGGGGGDGDDAELPWDFEEELVVHHARPTHLHQLRIILRSAVFLGALFGFATLTVRLCATVASKGFQRSPPREARKDIAHAF